MAYNFIKKETLIKVFFCYFNEIFGNKLLTEQLQATSSEQAQDDLQPPFVAWDKSEANLLWFCSKEKVINVLTAVKCNVKLKVKNVNEEIDKYINK